MLSLSWSKITLASNLWKPPLSAFPVLELQARTTIPVLKKKIVPYSDKDFSPIITKPMAPALSLTKGPTGHVEV